MLATGNVERIAEQRKTYMESGKIVAHFINITQLGALDDMATNGCPFRSFPQNNFILM